MLEFTVFRNEFRLIGTIQNIALVNFEIVQSANSSEGFKGGLSFIVTSQHRGTNGIVQQFGEVASGHGTFEHFTIAHAENILCTIAMQHFTGYFANRHANHISCALSRLFNVEALAHQDGVAVSFAHLLRSSRAYLYRSCCRSIAGCQNAQQFAVNSFNAGVAVNPCVALCVFNVKLTAQA